MNKLIVTFAIAFAALAGSPRVLANPVTLYLAPSTQTVGANSAFSMNVVVSGLTSGDNVSGFDLNLLFNSAVISGTGALENGALFGLRSFGPATVATGDLGLDGTSFETDATLIALQNAAAAAIAPDFVIATFDFLSGGSNGATRIDFGTFSPFESNVLGLLDANGNAVTHNAVFVGACVIVGTAGGNCDRQLPEPASYALVGIALAGALLPSAFRSRRSPAGLTVQVLKAPCGATVEQASTVAQPTIVSLIVVGKVLALLRPRRSACLLPQDWADTVSRLS